MTRSLSIVFLLFSAISTFAQTNSTITKAKVTFYSNGMSLLGGLPGHKQPAFKGRIFDGDQQLAFMEPKHYVTFEMKLGLHTLTATSWMAKHSTSGAHMTIDLQADRHYYIETASTNPGSGSGLFKIRQVTCEDATQYNPDTRPLDPSHLRPDGIPIAVTEKNFPYCP